MAGPRICAYCGGTFQPIRVTRKTCSDPCRQALSRRRRGWSPSSGKRRRRSSPARLEATGRGHVEDHRPIPRAALRFRPEEDGGAFTLHGEDGRIWCLVNLHPGGPWRLLERLPAQVAWQGRRARRLFAPGDQVSGPSSATRRAALVWAVLQVHRRTPRGYWLACSLEDQARDLRARAAGVARLELGQALEVIAGELEARASSIRSSRPASSSRGDGTSVPARVAELNS